LWGRSSSTAGVNYRRKTGHRQDYTEIKITDLKLG
jgi:ribosomal protein L21